MSIPINNLPKGTNIDNYTITKVLGGGGFSIVYLAREKETDKNVVIKEYMPRKLAKRGDDMSISALSEDKLNSFRGGRKLFFQEASILATLKHPNIVDVQGFFRANGTVYMVMAYEEGTNLQHIISKQKGGLSEQLILTVFPPLLDALHMIHERGFLHQDIKPGNIHICPGGSPRLLDFGAVQRRQVSRQFQPGQVTSSGFSPIEQHNKTGYVGPWTDIYAIGATIRSCIEGKPPPDAQDRHMKDTMKLSVAAFKKQYSIKLLEALDWALEVDPELRPQTILEFKNALPPLEEKPASFGARLLSRLTRSASLGRN